MAFYGGLGTSLLEDNLRFLNLVPSSSLFRSMLFHVRRTARQRINDSKDGKISETKSEKSEFLLGGGGKHVIWKSCTREEMNVSLYSNRDLEWPDLSMKYASFCSSGNHTNTLNWYTPLN